MHIKPNKNSKILRIFSIHLFLYTSKLKFVILSLLVKRVCYHKRPNDDLKLSLAVFPKFRTTRIKFVNFLIIALLIKLWMYFEVKVNVYNKRYKKKKNIVSFWQEYAAKRRHTNKGSKIWSEKLINICLCCCWLLVWIKCLCVSFRLVNSKRNWLMY